MLLALALVAFLPRVEDPWPDEIGVTSLFAAAGAGGMLAQLAYYKAPVEQREQAIRRWGNRGMCLGSAFYVVSLFAQVASQG